jgi:pyridoxine/pyridoxamine 5'-phosphate oxidase
MPKRRNQIAMTEEEQATFLREGHTLQVASIGPHGYPHQAAMWYALIDGVVHFTTYARSQKVLNLRRDPKISVMLETGTPYAELRGLVIEGDTELAARVMQMSGSRRPAELPAAPPSEQTLRAVAKRAVIRVSPVRVYSWDHRKLGGAY